MKNWIWYGNPKHFIGGNECRWHLATQIGDWIVSSVGEYLPLGFKRTNKQLFEEIGYDRFYETMVFKAMKCKCGCDRVICDVTKEHPELFGSYKTFTEAEKGHIEICLKLDKEMTEV